MTSPQHRSALPAAFIALLGSVAAAIAFLATNEWFGAGDLPGMVVWSLPLAGLIYVSFRPVVARLAAASPVWRYVVLVVLGGLLGLAWTVAAALLLGGWILAFSFPVLFCWISGGLVAGSVAAWRSERRTWPAAVVLVLLVIVALLRLNDYAQAPAPRVRVVLAPGTDNADEERFWREVVGRPGRRAGEFDLLDGISSVAATGHDAGRSVFTVTFRKSLDREERDSLIAQIRRSRIVGSLEVLPESDSSGVRVIPSY